MNHIRAYRNVYVLLLFSSVLMTTRLGNTHLWDQDEGYYATTAAEMYSRSDWITPTFNGKLFGHKPPMMFWGMIAGYHTFGVSELGARFVSSLFGIGTVLLTYLIAKRLFDSVTGLFAGLAISSSVMFVMVARSATADAHLTFFTVLALCAWIHVYLASSGTTRDEKLKSMRWHHWAIPYAVMGLAVLTKGPIGFLFPTAVIGLFLLTEMQTIGSAPNASRVNRWTHWLWPYTPVPFVMTVWRMRPISAVLMLALIAGPWYALVQWQTNGEFLREFLGVHHLGRFSNAMDNHSGPFYYYLVACIIGMYPWSAFAIPTVLHWVRPLRSETLRSQSLQKQQASQAVRFVSCWMGVYLVIFSLASTKLPNYVLPAYPALAIMVGRYFAVWIGNVNNVNRGWLHAGWILLVAVGLVLGIGIPGCGLLDLDGQTVLDRLHIETQIQPRIMWFGIVGVPLIVMGLIGWVQLRSGKTAWSAASFSIAAASMVGVLCQYVAPEVDRLQASQSLAQDWQPVTGRGRIAINVLGFFRPSMVFYFGQKLNFTDSAEEALRTSSDQNSIIITTSLQYQQIQDQLAPEMCVLHRVAQFPEGDELIVLGNKSLMR
ncbi:MAG: glycosyltransferase family 39 protein [Pirellula sp.]